MISFYQLKNLTSYQGSAKSKYQWIFGTFDRENSIQYLFSDLISTDHLKSKFSRSNVKTEKIKTIQ